MLQSIQKTGYRMLEQINSSLDLYRMEQGLYELHPEPVRLESLLNSIQIELEQLRHQYRVTMVIRVDKDVAVIGEELLLFCLFENLIKNALEAAPRDSSVTISTIGETDELRVEIYNSGMVPNSIQDRFFDKLTTAGKTGGTGLGAYSARLIALTHGGDIEMTTSEENGTRVTVRLPLSPPSD